MDVVIFAGGFGTRLSEETSKLPKPMVEIGDLPILVHIMRYYASFGYKNFIICGGYKVDYIKNYFSNFMRNMNDLQLSFSENKVRYINSSFIDWNVKIIDTGLKTKTAGRLARVKNLLESEKFLLTYGDGLSDVNLTALKKQHLESDNIVTLSAVIPPARFGALEIVENKIKKFIEKPKEFSSRINGGFMICDKKIISHIQEDNQSLEQDILPLIAENNDLGCYLHNGFWQPMDTLRDKKLLEKLWVNGLAKWKV